jgi:hypothetical protein
MHLPSKPKHRTEPAVVSLRKLDCQLHLAYSAKTVEHTYPLSTALLLLLLLLSG